LGSAGGVLGEGGLLGNNFFSTTCGLTVTGELFVGAVTVDDTAIRCKGELTKINPRIFFFKWILDDLLGLSLGLGRNTSLAAPS